MIPTKAKVFVMAKRFDGMPKPSDFAIKEEILPPLKDGDILVENDWWGVDPYTRFFMGRGPEGKTVVGGAVGRVLASKHKRFAVGDNVFGYLGWASHVVCNPDDEVPDMEEKVRKVEFTDLPLSYALGVLGMPGAAAYFGFLEVCKPKPGETVVVSGAAGAVGNLVGQIAKIMGCYVIGFAGSEKKVQWLKEECGFDCAYNYKTTDIVEALKEGAPNGVDCYFDNIGGPFSSAVIPQINHKGRIAVCGTISSYNATEPVLARSVQQYLLFNELTMEGFNSFRFTHRYPEAHKALYKWIKEGRIKVFEHVYEGFDTMHESFIDMLKGGNLGKPVVKAIKGKYGHTKA